MTTLLLGLMVAFLTYSFNGVHGIIYLSTSQQYGQTFKIKNLLIKEHFWTKSFFCYHLLLADLRRQGLKELAEWQGLKAALKSYFLGYPVELKNWPLDLSAYSPFACKVLLAVREIKPGQKRTYGQIARQIGQPQAARAVGRVMSQNKLPLFIPCHRVVGIKNKHGWSGPPGLKQQLLQLEQGKC